MKMPYIVAVALGLFIHFAPIAEAQAPGPGPSTPRYPNIPVFMSYGAAGDPEYTWAQFTRLSYPCIPWQTWKMEYNHRDFAVEPTIEQTGKATISVDWSYGEYDELRGYIRYNGLGDFERTSKLDGTEFPPEQFQASVQIDVYVDSPTVVNNTITMTFPRGFGLKDISFDPAPFGLESCTEVPPPPPAV